MKARVSPRSSSSTHPSGSVDYEQEYKIRSIIDERATKYLIDWADDEATGQSFTPTWEPKSNANQFAIKDWEEQKAARQVKRTAQAGPKKRHRTSSPARDSPEPTPKILRGRPRKKIIESSSPLNSPVAARGRTSYHYQSRQSASETVLTEREIAESQQSNIEARFSEPEDRTPRKSREPFVVLSDPPSSYQAGAYEKIASPRQSSASELSSEPARDRLEVAVVHSSGEPSLARDLPIQRQSTQANDHSDNSKVIPESQSQESWKSAARVFSSHRSLHLPSAEAAQSQPLQTEQAVWANPLSEQQHSSVDSNPSSTGIYTGVNLQQSSRPGRNAFAVNDDIHVDAPSPPHLTADTIGELENGRQSQHTQLPLDSPVLTNLLGTDQPPIARGGLSPFSSAQASPQRGVPTHGDSQQKPGTVQPSATNALNDVSLQCSAEYPRGPVTKAGATAEDGIVVSSENTEPSTDNFETPPKYEPPPAGQRPPPSSYLESRFPANRDPVYTHPATQSSLGFLTQLPQSSGIGLEFDQHTSPRARFNPQLNAPPSRASSLHTARSQESSPIPSVPSHTFRATGGSAPARLRTPSGSPDTSPARASMEAASTRSKVGESLSLVAKLQAMQEKHSSARNATSKEPPVSVLPPTVSAEFAAAQAARLGSPILILPDGTRSPSAVPAVEPSPVITKEEMNTSERYDTLLPQAQGSSSGSQGLYQHGTLTSLGVPMPSHSVHENPEVANMHVVPVPLITHQRDQYTGNVFYWRATIDQFLADRNPDEELLDKAERLIERLRSISLHPDLTNIDTLTQISSAERQAQWDEDCSAKFHFLKELLQRLQTSGLNMHVAVAIQGDRPPEMLETFLQGLHIPYKRNLYAAAEQAGHGQSGLKVSIVDLDKDVQEIDNVDLVIAMDGSTDYQHRLIRAFRRHVKTAEMSETNEWAMLLTLVAPRTIEHIERCMVPNISRQSRARVLLNAVLRIDNAVGKSEDGVDGQSARKNAAALIAEYLDDPEATEDGEWPLGGLSMIEDLDSQTDTDLGQSPYGAPASLEDDGLSGKRRFGTLSGGSPTETAKRPRLSTTGEDAPQMPASVNPQDMDMTHIIDSVGKSSQSNLPTADALSAAVATEQHLTGMLKQAQDRLDEHVKALEDLQYRHEDQRKELIEVTKTRDQTMESAQLYLQRMTLAESNNTTLRTERSELKLQLEDANRKLLDHSVPERAEFEALRVAAQQAQLDKEKAEKRAETTQKDLEWTRQMFQDASSRARELAGNNNDLQARLETALEQASGEQVRAQHASNDMRWKTLERENQKLRAIIKDRDAGLQFRDEEIARLKEAGRGRMGTRNTSVPRSPRLGSPIKPARSRQASPAAGELTRGRGSALNPNRAGS